MSRVFQGIGRNELNAAAQKVMDQMVNAPKRTVAMGDGTTTEIQAVPEKRLRMMLWKDVQQHEMDEVLNHLIGSDKLCRAELPSDPGKIFVVLKERL